MIKGLIKRAAKSIAQQVHIPKSAHAETELLAMGALLSKQQFSMNSESFNDYEFKIFSQWGDDGLIQFLIKNLDISNKTFIEFGVEDYSEANTRFLLMYNHWSGLVMDGSDKHMTKLVRQSWYWKHTLQSRAVFIDRENINELLQDSGLHDVGLLHIDIDGNDYHVLQAIDFERYNPAILIVEYNAVFGTERAISVPYDKTFVRSNAHYSNLYFGASIRALDIAATEKDYALVGCNLAGNNVYFVRKDLLNERVKQVPIEVAFKDSQFRESRNQDGSLSLLSGDDRIAAIRGLEVLNVETGQIEKI